MFDYNIKNNANRKFDLVNPANAIARICQHQTEEVLSEHLYSVLSAAAAPKGPKQRNAKRNIALGYLQHVAATV